jgi:hypothetical protein
MPWDTTERLEAPPLRITSELKATPVPADNTNPPPPLLVTVASTAIFEFAVKLKALALVQVIGTNTVILPPDGAAPTLVVVTRTELVPSAVVSVLVLRLASLG